MMIRRLWVRLTHVNYYKKATKVSTWDLPFGDDLIMERRSKLEIYLEVLQIIKGGTSKPTRIMYNANISWQPLMRVLGSMMKQGLVREIDVSDTGRKRDKRTTKIYEITMKGEQVVRYFRGAKELGIDESLIPV